MSNRIPLLENRPFFVDEADFESRNAIADSVIRLIHKDYSNPCLRFEEAARMFGISVWRLSRLFKKHTGICSKQYLKRLRMQRAESLLQTPEIGIKEVADAVGYSHVSNFNKHFKSFYGISPGEYRRRWALFKAERGEQDLPRIASFAKRKQDLPKNYP
jgi:AraC-like DNA-binding protein